MKAAAAAAAGSFSLHYADGGEKHQQHRTSWATLQQCALLAAAALGAAPALLLLDVAEQALLGLGAVRQHMCSSLDADKQQRPNQPRPLLPLWPPVVPVALAVAPLGLLVVPACRQACAAPALLLGASLVLQAYLNLGLVVWARARGNSKPTTAAAPPAWADSALCNNATAAAAQPVQAASQPSAAATALFAWVQMAGDCLRVGYSGCMAWLAAQAVAVRAAAQPDHASILVHALQQCVLHPADSSHVVAAASVAATAAQHLVHVWWSAGCVAAVCGGSAAVYGLSVLSRLNTSM